MAGLGCIMTAVAGLPVASSTWSVPSVRAAHAGVQITGHFSSSSQPTAAAAAAAVGCDDDEKWPVICTPACAALTLGTDQVEEATGRPATAVIMQPSPAISEREIGLENLG